MGGFYAYERYEHNKERVALNNELAKTQGMLKDTQTAYSSAGVEASNLKAQNDDLEKKIKDRDEKIGAAGQAVLQWKDKYYKIVNATGAVVDNSGAVTTVSSACQAELKDKRFKVSFSQDQDNTNISGFTLTNPDYAEVTLKWTKPLNLNIILAKNPDNTFRLYIDPSDPNLVPTKLNLTVDPSVFARSWYENLAVGVDLGMNTGVMSSFRLGYEFSNWLVGPFMAMTYDSKFNKYYGISVGWFPFRK
jgi:hypothetical protein